SHIQLIKADGSTEALNILPPAEGARTGHLRQIVPVNNGIWLGYFTDMLLYYDFLSQKFIRHYPQSKFFHTLLPYTERILLIASNELLKYDVVTGVSDTIMETGQGQLKPIYCLFRDPDGIIWAGSVNSLIRFDLAKGTNERIELKEEDYNVECICPGENGDLWLALLGGGVCRYNTVTREKRFYTTSTGLSNNTTYSILRDRSGYIWVSTNNGISRIDPTSGHIRVFNKSDGLDIVEFNSDAWFAAKDGEFFFGGVGGIAGFYPDSIDHIEEPAGRQKVIIDGIRVSGEARHFRNNANKADTAILRKGENNFQVTFSTADFINSEKTAYRYRLNGVDKDWTETNFRNRNINYSNLKPGRYRLLLQATDANGSWTGLKELMIKVQPSFAQTKFFLISVPLIILILTGLTIWFYIRQVKHREARKQDTLRLQALQGQMNPHFIFNSLNSINYFISKKDPLSANRYISDFSKVIRSILYNFNSEFITLEKEIESIEDYLNIEYLRFGDKFNFEVTVASGLPSWQTQVSPGLIQPFVENAIWHGVR
ncbi:MAG: histidine kinase, partial [Bacteroidales bacterium]